MHIGFTRSGREEGSQSPPPSSPVYPAHTIANSLCVRILLVFCPGPLPTPSPLPLIHSFPSRRHRKTIASSPHPATSWEGRGEKIVSSLPSPSLSTLVLQEEERTDDTFPRCQGTFFTFRATNARDLVLILTGGDTIIVALPTTLHAPHPSFPMFGFLSKLSFLGPMPFPTSPFLLIHPIYPPTPCVVYSELLL